MSIESNKTIDIWDIPEEHSKEMQYSTNMSHQPRNYLSRKRRHDEVMERDFMKQNTEFQTKLTDVNIDCLEQIFMYLDIDDFINIAHTNKELKPAADMAFARKFRKKQVILQIWSNREDSIVEIGKDTVGVFDFHTSLRLLRCFGHLFSKFDVQRITTSRSQHFFHGLKIVNYINEYCSESLLEIIWRNMRAGAFEELKKPFSIARNVEFFYCTLDGKFTQLSRWFPAMRQLRLHYIETQLEHIDANTRDLRRLTVIGRGRNYSAVMHVLRLGPRLQYLHLNVDGWVRFLQNAIENLGRLDSLYIEWDIGDILGVGDHIFNFRHLKKLQMDFNVVRYQSAPGMPISFQSVQELTWNARNQNLDQFLIEFFDKNSTITKLTLKQLVVSAMNGDINHIARALPLLQEIKFERIELSVDKVIPFLYQARLLRKIGFRMTNCLEFDRLKTLLNREWQASINGQRVELEFKG